MLIHTKRLGFTVQVHPDHREFIRVENEAQFHYEPGQLREASDRAHIEVMILNYDDALKIIQGMMILQSKEFFRKDIFEFLKGEAGRYVAMKEALDTGVGS